MPADDAWHRYLDALKQHFGTDATAVRHEVFFLRQKCYPKLSAFLALLRDGWYLSRLSSAPSETHPSQVYLVATLAGASGLGTLEFAANVLRSKNIPYRIMAHPRLKLPADAHVLSLTRPAIAAYVAALVDGTRYLRTQSTPLSSFVVACCMARHFLWRNVWIQTFQTLSTARPTVLLHNDFDMMSRACIAAAPAHARVACIQHGIPTDEFFPAHAPTQILWGETSRNAYVNAGYEGTLVLDALGRGAPKFATADEPPQQLLLISQTHTPIYGMDLTPLFGELATALAAHVAEFNVLLHPGELGKSSPYPKALWPMLQTPPHAALTLARPPCVVVAYSSTAMLEAACAGHYVLGMDWPAHASQHAFQLTRPPVICATAQDVIAQYHALQQRSDRRKEHHALQVEWLAKCFAASDAFAAWVETA